MPGDPPRLRVLLDQNVPRAVAAWLRALRSTWEVFHASEVGLAGALDPEVFAWSQQREAVVVTFDEDFADVRTHQPGQHHGIVRLRVWPTTIEETQKALQRLVESVPEEELRGALVVVDRGRIRVRRS